jgi:uncharacterized protein
LIAHNLHKKIAYFYPIGVYSWGNDAHQKSLTKEEFAEKEIGWLIEMLSKGFPPPSLTPLRKKSVCFAVSKTAELYDANGNIYDCSEVSYVPAYENTSYMLGNIKDNVALDVKRSHLNDWNDDILTDKFPCHTCKMLPVCGGACPKSWHEDMRACPSAKFNIKDKLLIGYIMSQKSKEESYLKLKEIMELYPEKRWAINLFKWIENLIDDTQNIVLEQII